MDLSEAEQKNNKDSGFLSVLVTTFTTIFIAELGDKTQITILMFSAQSGRPIVVFVAAASALIISSLIGVLLGRWIANSLPEKTFKLLAGLVMVTIGIWYGFKGVAGFVSYNSLL